MGGKLPLAVWSDWRSELHFGHIPFEYATRSFLDSKPAHVGAAYSVAAPVAVEREDVKAFWTVGCPDGVAERDH